MGFELPPIAKLATRALVDIEDAVSRFPRRHRYAAGARLVDKALEAAELTQLAWRDRRRQTEHVRALVQVVDQLRLRLQVAKELHAFKSFAQFEHIAREVDEFGRQCGGWLKQRETLDGQNAKRKERAPQRPETLSIAATPAGGHAMTTPCYPVAAGCGAGSQERREAYSPYAGDPAEYAWIVNFNNGNANYNHRDNNGFVRAVRSVRAPSECQQSVSFRGLYEAWRRARRHKVPSPNQMAFESRWISALIDLERRIAAGAWTPSPSMCFVAQRPKAREIHAPDFGDRVVHHWLVPQLEAVFEPGFIHDSFSNRVGKGTHAAVARLTDFVRQVARGQGGGWFLQLDIANFFNSIYRPTLWRALKRRMVSAGVHDDAQRVAHALLRQDVATTGVIQCSPPVERAKVPMHKRLESAAPGCGLPIGNLSSQFFANVYLDALDQFVKHQLKVKRYVRYVDDFVLVHHDREQLARWQRQIERFLMDRLRLRLKAGPKLAQLRDGVDFLGYVIRPTHTLVRRRVVGHARDALAAWERAHRRDDVITATPSEWQAVACVWSSYRGHFRHANARRLRASLVRRHPWLDRLDGIARTYARARADRLVSIEVSA